MRIVYLAIIAYAISAALPGRYAALSLAAQAPGTPVWEVRQEPDDENAASQGRGVALDAEGNLLVAGFIEGADGNYDIVTYKYSPEGYLVWSRRYDYSWYDIGTAVACDADGNVLVAGASNDPDNPIDINLKTYYTDYILLKYSPDGELLFEVAASGNDKNNEPAAVCADRSGGIYVTGRAQDATGSRNAYYTVKFEPSGEIAWERVEDWGTESAATGIALTPDGVAVTGYVYGEEQGNDDIMTLLYSRDAGDVLAMSMYRAPGQYYDEEPYALAADPGGNLFIAGRTSDEEGVTLTLKLDDSLKPVWAEPFYILQKVNEGRAVGVDEHGRVFDACRTGDQYTEEGLMVLVYGPDGRLVDTRSVEIDNDFVLEDMVLEPDGDLVVTGTAYIEGTPRPGSEAARIPVMSTMRIAGYPAVTHSSFNLEEEIVKGKELKLAQPPGRMLRRVSLSMDTVIERGCLPVAVFTAQPLVPGKYEYSFFVTRGDGEVWEKVRGYSPANTWTLAPRVGNNAVTGVMVEARKQGSTMEYEAREYIWLDMDSP